jgi:ATP synthase protein I
MEAASRAAGSDPSCSTASMRNGVLVVQAALTAACVGLTWLYRDQHAAIAALYGGAIATANTWLLTQRIARAGELAKRNVKYSIYSLYFGAVQRFIFVLVCLGVGLGGIGLDPVPLLLTFGIAQLAFMIAAAKEAMRQAGPG